MVAKRWLGVPCVIGLLVALDTPVAAQEAAFCADQAEKLSGAFSLQDASPRDNDLLAGAPGTRKGAKLTDAQLKQLRGLISEAHAAGSRKDGDLCQTRLNEARAILRSAGVGTSSPTTTYPSARDALPADRSPSLQGPQPAPGVRETLREGSTPSPAERIPGPGISGGIRSPGNGMNRN